MSMLSTTKHRNSCLILAMFFALLLHGITYAQTILRVDGDGGLANGDGLTWPTAYRYLQDALAFARVNAGSYDIWVAATEMSNPYRPDRDAAFPNGTGLRASTFLLNFNSVQLLGGFPPGGGVLDDRDPALYETVLSGLLDPGCGTPVAGGCYENNGTPFCDNTECCDAVCAVIPDCCEVGWDQACADLAFTLCGSCGDPEAGSCFVANGTPGCDDLSCCEAVCTMVPDCCEVAWDQACANLASIVCGSCGDPAAGDCWEDNGTPGCDFVTCCVLVCTLDPDCCEVAWDQACADLAFSDCGVCGHPDAGDCFVENGTPGCEDANCCAAVCAADPICCILEWDQTCVDIANDICSLLPLGGPPKAYHVVTADGVDDSVRIDGFTVTDGLADVGSNGRGAGMLIDSASSAVVRIIFAENAAPLHGGGAMNITGISDPLIVNCEFIANTGHEAGALHTEGGFAGGTFVNCLFSKNTSVIEGGAINPGANGDLNFINCTFADNSVGNAQGGNAIFTEVGVGPVNLTNCILWGNAFGGSANQIVDSQNQVAATFSDIEGGWGDPPDMNIDDDPLFVDPLNGDYRLDNGSPCIDAADNDAVPCDEFDIDHNDLNCLSDPIQDTPDLDLGKRRIDDPDTDDTGNGFAPIVDMGTYEFCPPNSCPWDLDSGGFVGAGDLLLLLADWGNPYGAADLLALLADWGPCPCDPDIVVLTLAEELADACLSQADWDDFVDVMADPNAPQVKKDRYNCWMTHYLFHCNKCTCEHRDHCPNPDPFN